MAHGNLAGKLVPHDFWPACENCRRFVACQVRPQHPAYPHSWHWAREFAAFADGTLIVFPVDAEKWIEDSRWLRSARPDEDGKAQIRALPPGDYYAVAVDYVEDGMWNDPEYLDAVRRYAQRITLGETGAQTVTLKVVTP